MRRLWMNLQWACRTIGLRPLPPHVGLSGIALAGEIISGRYGIGYFTWTSDDLVQYPHIIVGMLSIGLLGTLSTLLVLYGTRPRLRWRQRVGARD